ncbi:MAG TPA: DUF1501 domain-containing protein [Stellaceae bacterium]|nr:DUF1501 domain-containing protein [Stellaceae bacterium]
MLRREFLRLSTAAAGLSIIDIGARAWAASGDDASPRRLVVVLLRGAVDGLNVVVPYSDTIYYEARPTIAVPRARQQDGALDLDGRFGLHPALAPLMPMWQERSLAFIHAAGSPDPTRSHFDAQDYMESGTPGRKATPDGWMNRLLAQLPGKRSATTGVAFGPTLPRSFAGEMRVTNIATGRAANNPMPIDRPIINAAFDQLYSGDDPLSRAYREGVGARAKLLDDLQQDMVQADHGAPSPVGFAQDTQHLVDLIKRDPGVQLAFFDLGGWDTHVNQGTSEGQLANHLKPLAEGLGVLARGLGASYRDTVIVVMSEFGRTVHENGNRGTDHGHGNAMWVMGGAVKGGRVYGVWPGLTDSALYQGRDLAVTTDFRSALALVLERHLRLDKHALDLVFPGAPPAPAAITGMV